MSRGGDPVRLGLDKQLRVQPPRSLPAFRLYARPGWPPNRSPPQSPAALLQRAVPDQFPKVQFRRRHSALKGANVSWTQVASADRLPGQDERGANQDEQSEDHVAGDQACATKSLSRVAPPRHVATDDCRDCKTGRRHERQSRDATCDQWCWAPRKTEEDTESSHDEADRNQGGCHNAEIERHRRKDRISGW